MSPLMHSSPAPPARRSPAALALLLGLLLTVALPGCGRGQDFPNRPVILIVPWAAGGGTDRVARQLAVGLERELGVPVNVVNATGASGVTGHTRGALARPDGYTLTLITVELNMLHWRGLTPLTYQDFQPVALVNRDPAALFVRKDAPWQTLDELSDHVRRQPRTLRASGTALGGIWHIALAGWLTGLGMDPEAVRWISIEGTSPSLQELLAGGVDIVCTSLPEARSLLDAGEIRALGVMAEERVAQFPQVPTFREQGIDHTLGVWRGVALPAGAPEPVVAEIVAATERVVTGSEFREFMQKTGFNWAYEEPAAFEASLARLDQTFGELLTSPAFQDIGQDIVGPMAFPTLIGTLLVIVIVALVASGSLGRTAAADTFSWMGTWRVLEVLAAILLYLLVAELVGFVLTASAIVAFLMWRLAVRPPLAAGLSLAITVVIYQIFAIYLRVPLPQGLFGW
jgi:tripartite-type tricarboxylate transporter receptor subunit TctC